MHKSVFLILSTTLLVGLLHADAPTSEEKIDFNREIRPILSRNCFACHGTDEGHRKAGLRLDLFEQATKTNRKGRTAIVPGKPNESELLKRIIAHDETEVMPPKETGNELTKEEIKKLSKWIEQGAHYAGHWAFLKPVAPQLPTVIEKAWPKNAIDNFILSRLEKEALAHNPPAKKHEWLRRLSLDLRGLPPTMQEIEEANKETDPNSYNRWVKRFLNDPAYGEKWARMWLDLARYADSAGFGSDPLRPNMYRYRDWVIAALNNNMPFDQFTREQLAGDLLPSATLEQRIATAFHRNTMTNTEGGTDREEYRVAAVKDRINTTMQVWMGLTMGCAQCHTHKYDPISHKEYYQMFAIFNQTEDHDQPNEAPTMPAPTAEQAKKQAELEAALKPLQAELSRPWPGQKESQAKWEASLQIQLNWVYLAPVTLRAEKITFQTGKDLVITASGNRPAKATYELAFNLPLPLLTGLRIETFPEATPQNIVITRVHASLRSSEGKEGKPLEFGTAAADFSQANFPVTSILTQKDNKTGWGIGPQIDKPHWANFTLKQPQQVSTDAVLTLKIEQQYEYENQSLTLGKFRIAVHADAAEIARSNVPAEMLRFIDKANPSEEEKAKLARYYHSIAPELKPLRDKIATLEKQKPTISKLPVMKELPKDKHRITRIMNKGNFLDPADAVEPGVLGSFHKLPANTSLNRLTLSDWLLSPDNPLTARVTVNRVWAQLFGIGLVESEEDFGTQGDLPSHPELLDWLALEFQHTLKWDIKKLIELIVTSATYQQSSQVGSIALSKDPRNRLLGRAPRYRLDAEAIRDQALAFSGLLSRKLGGPSVFPYQPPNLWQAAFNGQRNWTTSEGEDQFRRGIYTFWRRTIPYPSMTAFDAPSRETCTIRRVRSNTPVQAFVTLNDPVYVQTAQHLAKRIIQEGGADVESRIRFAVKLIHAGQEDASAIEKLRKLYASQKDYYLGKPDLAKQLIDAKVTLPPNTSDAELAAWTVIANVLLNLDSVLVKG